LARKKKFWQFLVASPSALSSFGKEKERSKQPADRRVN
jgi:hypothetical protein